MIIVVTDTMEYKLHFDIMYIMYIFLCIHAESTSYNNTSHAVTTNKLVHKSAKRHVHPITNVPSDKWILRL